MRINNYRKKFWTIVAVCGFALVAGFAIADDDSDNDLDIAKALETNSIMQLKLKMDAVYGEISAAYPTVEPILKKSCYDCHSSQTSYPWYHSVPGIKGMIDSHVKEGREQFDLSNGFPFGGGGIDQLKALRELKEEIDEDEMPLTMYRMMNWGTTIEGATKDSLFMWLDSSIEKLEGLYESLGLPINADEDENDEHHSDDNDDD